MPKATAKKPAQPEQQSFDQPPPASYESLLEQLQTTVARLESGNLTLAESLHLYEEGVRLAAACQDVLDKAELRLHQLQSPDNAPDA